MSEVALMEEVAPPEGGGNIIALPTPAAVVNPAAPVADEEDDDESPYLKVDGKKFLLFKKHAGRDASYYVRFNFDKKTHKLCLGSNVKSVAKRNAREFIARVRKGKWEDAEKLKSRADVAKLGEVLDVFYPENGPRLTEASCADDTAYDYVYAIKFILRIVKGWGAAPKDNPRRKGIALGELAKVEAKVRDVSLSEISGELVRDFENAMVRKAVAGLDGSKARLAKERALRSARSFVFHARCVFKSKAGDLRPVYEKHGLRIPLCVEGFLTAKLLGKDKSAAEYLAPPDSVLKDTFECIGPKAILDPDVFKAFWLACCAGLRRGEIAKARWEHFVMRDGELWFSGAVGEDAAAGKNGKLIEVPVAEDGWKHLEPMRKAEGFIVSDGSNRAWERRLNGFMTEMKWTTEHKMHELRSYIGSLLYRSGAPLAAMLFMRHSSIKTTERFYVRYGKLAKMPKVKIG